MLIVGGAGLFGSRLARLLATRQAYRLTLGGRNPARALELLAQLNTIDPDGNHRAIEIDRTTATAAELAVTGANIVVDAAGPFQGSLYRLAEAAIDTGIHYLDLADGRSFVSGIVALDAKARAAGVAVVSGASTTPALTHAVIAESTAGWWSIDTIDIAIVPGNKTPKGASVISGILNWIGQPVSVFDRSRTVERHGWGDTRRVVMPDGASRLVGLADVPDLDLLPERFRPRLRAWFGAGMELGLLHLLIGVLGQAVRRGLVRDAAKFTVLGTAVARALEPFGSNSGGMVVRVDGIDAAGMPTIVAWSLWAERGDGPFVPAVAAAALIARLANGQADLVGALPAAGTVSLQQILPWFGGLAISTATKMLDTPPPLFRQALGEAFDRLPTANQAIHRSRPAVIARGEAEVSGPANLLAGLIARLFSFPASATAIPVEVIVEERGGAEYWTRYFDGKPMRSVMSKASDGTIEERFGSMTFTLQLTASEQGLDMVPVAGKLWRMPLPEWLLPRVKARERVDGRGRHTFDVEIEAPVVGRLVAYRGWLALA